MQINDYLALFPGASREKPRFMALAEAVLSQASDLMALTAAIPAALSLEGAEGEQLDRLAAGLGLTRADCPEGGGAADADFRRFLLEKLRLWRWDGTNEHTL